MYKVLGPHPRPDTYNWESIDKLKAEKTILEEALKEVCEFINVLYDEGELSGQNADEVLNKAYDALGIKEGDEF